MKNLTVNMPLAVPHQKPPSKYASHPYPLLIDEDAYLPTVKPLNIALIQLLQEVSIDEAFAVGITPLNITKKEPLVQIIVDNEGCSVSLKPLSILRKEPLVRINVMTDAVQPFVNSKNIVMKRVLIEHYEAYSDGCIPSIHPLNITLKIK